MATDPFIQSNPIVNGLEQRRARIEQTRENASRLAQSYNFVETIGVGQIRLPTVVPFNCTFIEKPVVGYGYTVESDLVTGDFPSSAGAVYDWQTDRRGFYIGAYVFCVVVGTAEDITIQHDFTFTGIAMKDLPEHLLDL